MKKIKKMKNFKYFFELKNPACAGFCGYFGSVRVKVLPTFI